ncbi:metal ABC transporter substrate-binding protein [Candidatus Uabimicrobium amorphum]|uniref:Adhesin n=1 Tax=Uabimicrobium amorphum TaxID=2596890 RepID=A0A5S9F628_UABAM|nr:metal ABC transporter substrate-binding protein [Candidatus Uabimicrobium amorphum]BBM87457.1 adhesin [Candidatus Uabimicrobium amorphum]
MKKICIFLVFSLILACDSPQQSNEKKIPIDVYTTFYPTAYFAKRIAGQYANVVCPVPQDEDAIFWKAYKHPEIIQKYQQADLIILNGAKFAKWVRKVSLPQNKVVNTSKPFSKNFITIENATTHSHGDGKVHTHKGLDGHTWVDPHNAKVQAHEITKALCKILPQHKEQMQKNFTALQKDLDALIATLEQYQKTANNNEPLLASHPAYNYIARTFSWNIKNLDLDPQTMPTPKQFAAIQALQKKHPAKFILWEEYPTDEIAKAFKDKLNLTSIEFSPCELLGEEQQKQGEDYLSVMRKNVANLQAIWK